MAKPKRRKAVNHDLRAYQMTYSLLHAETLDGMVASIEQKVEDLSYQDSNTVLSRVIGAQLALITELSELPGAAAHLQEFKSRIGDFIITTELAEVNHR